VGSNDIVIVLDGVPETGSLTPPPVEGEIWGSNPQTKRAIANCSQTASSMLPPGEYKRGVGWTCHSDSAFCQITLFLVTSELQDRLRYAF